MLPFAVSSTVTILGRWRRVCAEPTLAVAARMSTHQHSDRERRLLELVRDPLFVTSSDGRSHAANAAGLEMLGLSEEDFLAASWWDLIPEDDRPGAELNLAGILEHGGTSEPFRLRILTARGQV